MRKWTRAMCGITAFQWVISAILGVMWAFGSPPDPPTWLIVVFATATVGATLSTAAQVLPVTRAFSIGVRWGRNLEQRREGPTDMEDANH